MFILLLLFLIVPVVFGVIVIIKVICDSKKTDCNNCPYRDNNTYL